jgi:predicted transcriptional regulator
MGMMSLHLPAHVARELEHMTEATGLTQSALAGRAIEDYLQREAWQIAEIERALKEADAGDFATDDEMKTTLGKWGR